VQDLAECDFGEWEGKTVAQLKTDVRFQDWISGKRTDIPGGESAEAFQLRVKTVFEMIVENLMRTGETDAVVCTHGGVVMLIMAAYALPRSPLQAWTGPDGCGYTLRITPSLWMREPVAEAIAELPVQESGTKS
jgi:alpha-ribazole phosphatase